MQAALLLVLVVGANAFLKQDVQIADDGALSSWEQIQEDALARTGDELPKTVIRVAEAKPKPSAFIQMEVSADAAQEVMLKAPECMDCVKEHLAYEGDIMTIFDEDKAEQLCSFCALYAFGGIYAGKDAEVNPKAWGLLPKTKITLLEDNSLLASPARMQFWKDAANQVASGNFDLKDAIAEAKELNDDTFNVLQCKASLNAEKCTVHTEAFGSVGPTVLLEVQSKALLAQKYKKLQTGISSMMGFAQHQMKESMKDLEEAKLTGSAMDIAIAKEALAMQQALAGDVLEEQEDLRSRLEQKEKVSVGALLQEQSIEQLANAEKQAIQDCVRKAIEQLKSSDGSEQGEALLAAAKTALDAPVELSPQQVTQIDNLLQDAVLGLGNVDTMGTLALSEATRQVEESSTQVFKSVMGNKAHKAQFKELVQRLSKFLPAEGQAKPSQLQTTSVTTKSNRTNATNVIAKSATKTTEDHKKEALKALTDALSNPLEMMKKADSVSASASYLADIDKNAEEHAKESKPKVSLIEAVEKVEATKMTTEEHEKAQTLNAIEHDLQQLLDFNPQGQMWDEKEEMEDDLIE